MYIPPPPTLSQAFASRLLLAQERHELRSALIGRGLSQIAADAAMLTLKYYGKCTLPYVSYTSSKLQHDDAALASASSRGSLVAVDCRDKDGFLSRWYGILRLFCELVPPPVTPCAYVDFFQRVREGESSPVARHPIGDPPRPRIVPITDLRGKVMLLPGPNVWCVVDGIQD